MESPPVVRIFAHAQFPDYDSPWQSQPPTSCTGSGVIIGKRRILTGAHVVANATFLQVQRLEDPDKVIARVRAISHDCDLALLEVEGGSLSRGVRRTVIGALPDLRDKVSVVGFPVGGDEISITEGVVSRVEVQRYQHSQRGLLAATVDAAINEGNSGGPVFKDGDVIGIAFQKLSGAESIGEMVPAPIIKRFLAAAEREALVSFPSLGIDTQNLENPTLREALGLARGQSGVLVTRVDYGNSASGVLLPRDALLSIDGHRIANNGTVRYRGKYRTMFPVILGERAVGDRVGVTVLREGQRVALELELMPLLRLVPHSQYDVRPSYLIWGGLVLQTLTRDFLETWDEWSTEAPKELLNLYYQGAPTEERRQAILVTRVLADDINIGYGFADYELVEHVAGRRPRDLAQMAAWLDAARGLVEIGTSRGSVLVFDAEDVRRASARILERYRIPADRSDDLRPGGAPREAPRTMVEEERPLGNGTSSAGPSPDGPR